MSQYYRIEMHLHTRESSPCASVNAPEIVDRYLAKGYDAIVVTDHLSSEYLRAAGDRPWEVVVPSFMAGYKAVKEAAGDRLKIYLGMEIRFPATANDYLVYGFDEQFLWDHPFICMKTIRELHDLCQGTPIRIFQAHPFRYGMTLENPDWIDGMEVFNGSPKHRSHNDFAGMWASFHEYPAVAGSDFHNRGEEGRGGILLPYLPENEIALSEALVSPDKMLMTAQK